MGVEDLAGIPSSAEGGFFDPFQLSKGKDEETINWYRSAELKHGRISMLATLGIVIQGYNTKIIPGFPVTDTNAINALKKVYYEAPSALVQVCTASPFETKQEDFSNLKLFNNSTTAVPRSYSPSLPLRSFAHQ